MATFDYSSQMPDFSYGLTRDQIGRYGQNTGNGQAWSPQILRYTSSTPAPELPGLGSRAREMMSGLGGKFKDYMFGNQQPIDVTTASTVDMNKLKTSMADLKTLQEAQKLGINPDGSAINTGLLGRAQSFAGSNLAKGLGSALMGAAQLGLGYKSFKEGQKMNKELIKDMRTNRANLAEDRARAAKDRETFSQMMNTL